MEKFEFSSETKPMPVTTFNGPEFYKVYKEAEFLRSSANVENILEKGYELRQKLNKEQPGIAIKIEGMVLERNTPLLVKRTGEGVKLEDYEFTYNRLIGLVAAYAYENRHRFPRIVSSESTSLGLVWNTENRENCQLYLSAVSGTEHFTDQFSFLPLLCALKKYQLKKMPEKLVIKMAKIKNDNGDIMAKVLKSNLIVATRLWLKFPGSKAADLGQILNTVSPELRKLFIQK